MEEDALMERAAQGDVLAFGRLVSAYQRRLVRFAERLIGDAEAAEDVAQEAFLRLWRARADYRSQGSLDHYLLRIVRNLCLDYARSVRPTAVAEMECRSEACLETCVAAKVTAEAVRQAVADLPEPQRVVFVMSQYEGLSYREIAAVLDCPVGTVASRKHEALETLRRRLKPWMEGDATR